MGEYFEVTFFSCKNCEDGQHEKDSLLLCLNLAEGKNLVQQHRYPLFSNREVLFDVFEEADFFEYRICLSNFILTKKNMEDMRKQLLKVVDTCFNRVESILFATGIYELTYHYIEGITYIKDFNKNVLLNFPFLFFKNGKEFGMLPTEWYGNTSCVMNTGDTVQQIYPSDD